jgi:hypothetical protein
MSAFYLSIFFNDVKVVQVQLALFAEEESTLPVFKLQSLLGIRRPGIPNIEVAATLPVLHDHSGRLHSYDEEAKAGPTHTEPPNTDPSQPG